MEKPFHYLVVDDDTTNNLICEFTIRRFDDKALVQLFTRPEEALEWIEERGYVLNSRTNILFLDVNMPTLSGFEFLEEFERLPGEVKDQYTIYMLTSSIEDFSHQAEKYPRVKNFLSKPMKLLYLEQIMKDFQESH